jgi:hypothetical protein
MRLLQPQVLDMMVVPFHLLVGERGLRSEAGALGDAVAVEEGSRRLAAMMGLRPRNLSAFDRAIASWD